MSTDLSGDRRPPTLVRAAAATFGINAAAISFSLMNVLILARALGPTGRGEIAFILAVSGLAAALSSAGVEEANANLGGQRPELRRTLATNSVLLALVLGLAAALIMIVLIILVPSIDGGADQALLFIALATIPVGLLQLYLKLLLQSGYRYGVTNIAWVASPAATALVNGTTALLGVLTVETAVITWLVTGAMSMLILVVSTARHFGFGRPDIKVARETLTFGLKTHLSKIMALGNYRADQWLVGVLAGPYQLGLYSVAVTVAEALFYIPGVIILIQRPVLVRARRSEAAAMAARVFRRALLLSTAAAATLFVVAPFAVPLVFGTEFRGSVDQLRVLVLGAVGYLARDLLANAIVAQRRPLLVSVADASAFAVTLVFGLLLIPSLGGLGAAIAKSAAFITGGLAMAAIFHRVFGGEIRAFIPRRDDAHWYWRSAQSQLPRLLGRKDQPTDDSPR